MTQKMWPSPPGPTLGASIFHHPPGQSQAPLVVAVNSWDSGLSENRSKGPRGPARHPKVGSEGVLACRLGWRTLERGICPGERLVGMAGFMTSEVLGVSGSRWNEPLVAVRFGNSTVLNFWDGQFLIICYFDPWVCGSRFMSLWQWYVIRVILRSHF